MIESQHLKLKRSLRAYAQNSWSTILTYIVLVWNNSITNDHHFTAAQLVKVYQMTYSSKMKEQNRNFTPIIPDHHAY